MTGYIQKLQLTLIKVLYDFLLRSFKNSIQKTCCFSERLLKRSSYEAGTKNVSFDYVQFFQKIVVLGQISSNI